MPFNQKEWKGSEVGRWKFSLMLIPLKDFVCCFPEYRKQSIKYLFRCSVEVPLLSGILD